MRGSWVGLVSRACVCAVYTELLVVELNCQSHAASLLLPLSTSGGWLVHVVCGFVDVQWRAE